MVPCDVNENIFRFGSLLIKFTAPMKKKVQDNKISLYSFVFLK